MNKSGDVGWAAGSSFQVAKFVFKANFQRPNLCRQGSTLAHSVGQPTNTGTYAANIPVDIRAVKDLSFPTD
jgi:hypothetical protein